MGKWDQGLGAIGLILLAVALAAVISIWGPIAVSKEQVELKDWLGFAANLLGALVALGAAFYAWKAVQLQVRVQRNAMLLDVIAREEDRLEAEREAVAYLQHLAIALVRGGTKASANLYAQDLQQLGFVDDPIAMRQFLEDKVGKQGVPFETLSYAAYMFAEVTAHVNRMAELEDRILLGHEKDGSDEERRQTEIMSKWLDLLSKFIDGHRARQVKINALLPTYRSHIEAGLKSLHD